jgi:hypothetical protein
MDGIELTNNKAMLVQSSILEPKIQLRIFPLYMTSPHAGTSKSILMSNRPETKLRFLPSGLFVDIPYREPFLPSGKVQTDPSHLGLPPAREEEEAHLQAKCNLFERQREQKEQNANVKHKKWIKELNLQKIEERMNAIEEESLREKRRKNFAETQSKLRKALMNCSAPGRLLQNIADNNHSDEQNKEIQQATVTQALAQAIETQKKEDQPNKIENKKVGQEKQKTQYKTKPKWAMSEEEAEKVLDEEVENLINFANSLNFEDIIDDMEIREALNVIHTKVSAKRKEESNVANTQGDMSYRQEIASSTRSTTASTIAELAPKKSSRPSTAAIHEKDWDSSTTISKDEERDLLELESVPAPLKTVHSKASIHSILESLRSRDRDREKDELKIDNLLKEISNTVREANQLGPMLVCHDRNHTGPPHVAKFLSEDNNNRVLLKLKKDDNYVQNLPYLYRCPSI